MPPKKDREFKCIVISIDSCLQIPIGEKTRGSELLDLVCKKLGVFEKSWFGLHFTTKEDNTQWLEAKERVNLNHVKPMPGSNAHFNFTIRYYPECIKIELIQDVVRVLFFKHELSRLVSDPELYVTPEELVLACVSYACLVHHENPSITPEQVIEKKFDKLFPKHVLNRYDLSKVEWEDAIFSALSLAKTQHYSESVLQCLNFMEQSPMYGVSYHPIKNKKGTSLFIGFDCYGINIYKSSDRVNPVINFLWSEVHSVGYEGKIFRITMVEKSAKPFEFYAKNEIQSKQMLICVEGNHKNFLARRRTQDTSSIDIKEAQRAQETEDYKKKKFEEAKKSELQYQQVVDTMVSTGKIDEDKVNESFTSVQKVMEEQIEEAKKQAEEERRKKEQAEKEMERVRREAKDMAEKLQIEEECRIKQAELEEERKKNEEQQKREMQALQQQLEELKLKHELDLKRMEELKRAPQPSEGTKTLSKPVSYEEVKKKKNAEMKDQMKKFGTLAKTKSKVGSTAAEQVENFKAGGRSKFETLKMLRKNNTRARIDEFESL